MGSYWRRNQRRIGWLQNNFLWFSVLDDAPAFHDGNMRPDFDGFVQVVGQELLGSLSAWWQPSLVFSFCPEPPSCFRFLQDCVYETAFGKCLVLGYRALWRDGQGKQSIRQTGLLARKSGLNKLFTGLALYR